MNILFLSTHINKGGITSYIFTLSKIFYSQGHKIFIASSGGEEEENFKSIGADLFIINIKTKSELSPKIYMAIPSLKRYIQKNKIDIIHSQTRITQVMGTFLNKMTKVAHITTCHGYFKPRLSRKIFGCWGDAVIAISPAVKAHLQQDLGVTDNKIFFILNGIDLKRFSLCALHKKKELRNKYNLSEEDIIIGIIARLSSVKGHDILIHAMGEVCKRFPHVRLFIAGEGKTKSTLRQLAKEHRIIDKIIFYPNVSDTTEILSLIDIFVMPSRSEGLGLAVMEAQAAGLPVIVSKIGGLPYVVQHNKTGLLVESENIKQLSNAIIALIQDRQLANRLGTMAREYAFNNYSAEGMAEETMKVYKKFINKDKDI